MSYNLRNRNLVGEMLQMENKVTSVQECFSRLKMFLVKPYLQERYCMVTSQVFESWYSNDTWDRWIAARSIWRSKFTFS